MKQAQRRKCHDPETLLTFFALDRLKKEKQIDKSLIFTWIVFKKCFDKHFFIRVTPLKKGNF